MHKFNSEGHIMRRGFTLVELLIVIVVIAILATISTPAFTGIQARANDARMRSGINQLEKAISIWATQNPVPLRAGWSSTAPLSNGRCSDGSGGWIFAGSYVCSLEDTLIAANLLPEGFTRSMPPNKEQATINDGRYSIMFYPCGGSTGRYALYWHLRNPSAEDAANIAAVEAAGCTSGPRVHYKMNAAKLLLLN